MSNPIDPFEADKPGYVLKPCPFCGSSNIQKAARRDFPVWTECLECRTTGPAKLTGREADTAWNQRSEVKSSVPCQQSTFQPKGDGKIPTTVPSLPSGVSSPIQKGDL